MFLLLVLLTTVTSCHGEKPYHPTIHDIVCPDVSTTWNAPINTTCLVIMKKSDIYVFECFWRNETDAAWSKLLRYSTTGLIEEAEHAGTIVTTYNNTGHKTNTTETQSIHIQHLRYPTGPSYYRCEFVTTFDTYVTHWTLRSYPIITLTTGFRVRDIFATVTVNSSSANNLSVIAKNARGDLLPITSTTTQDNENGTTSVYLAIAASWDTTQGNVTIDVAMHGHHYLKAFIFHRHSHIYYLTLMSFLVLAAVVLVSYIIYRLRSRSSTVPYMRGLE